MRPVRSLVLPVVVTSAVVGAALTVPATAGTPAGVIRGLGVVAHASTSSYNGGPYASPDVLSTYVTRAGDLGIVRVDTARHTLAISSIDPATRKAVGSPKSVSFGAWPLFGGVYTAPDGDHFLLTGRANPKQDDDKPVVSIRRFTPAWKAAGSAELTGRPAGIGPYGIVTPFDGTAPAMLQVGDRLVVSMARQQYTTGDGVRHQVNLDVEVDLTTMKATVFDKLGASPYASHSFHQLLTAHGSDLVLLDHGDAYPRGLQLSVIKDYPKSRDVASTNVFPFTGAVGDNTTGTEATGLVSGPSGVLLAGASVPHRHAVRGVTGGGSGLSQNVFVIVTDPDTGKSSFHWITNLDPKARATALEPRITQVGSDRFALLFSVRTGSRTTMEYRLLDSRGRVLARHTWTKAYFSPASQPVMAGSTLSWAGVADGVQAGAATSSYLFGLDLSDPAAPRRLGSKHYVPSSDAAMRSMRIEGGRLVGRFSAGHTSYRARATHQFAGVLDVVTRDPGATVAFKFPDGPWSSEQRLYYSPKGSRFVERVRVTAEDGKSRTVYTFRFQRPR